MKMKMMIETDSVAGKGYGVSAVEDIKRGTVIHNLSGTIYSERTRESVEIYLEIGGKKKTRHIVDEVFQYCNHSEAPNVVIDKASHNVVAVRDIKEGEEITFNYKSHESKISFPFKDKETGKQVA